MKLTHRLTLPRLLAFAILALAAILRFQNLTAIEHNVDHAYPVWQALMTLDRGIFPVTAQGTSVLFANPALTGYLFIPWVWITRSPVGPYVFVLLLNTFAVWLAFRAAALLLDERRALVAMFLMAVNPWVIEYSRTTWVQALLPFFACLVFWLLTPVLLGVARHPRRRTVSALVAVAAMTQTYLLAFMILAPVLVLAVIFHRKLSKRALVIGTAVFIFSLLIYGIGLAASSAETLARVREFSGGTAHLSPLAWMHAARLVSGENYAYERRRDLPMEDVAPREYASEALHYVVLVALLAGILTATSRVIRRKPDAGAAIITLIWFGAPVLLMTNVSKPVHPFYLLLTLPAGYVLAAWALGPLLRYRPGLALVTLVLLLAAGLNGLNVVRFAQSSLANPGPNGLGALPLGDGLRITARLRDGSIGLVVADVDEWTLNSLAGRLFPVERDVTRAGQVTYAAAGGTLYLQLLRMGDGGSQPTALNWAPIARAGGAGTPDLQAFTETSLALPGDYRIQYAALPALAERIAMRPTDYRGDRGITFLGWAVDSSLKAGDAATITTYWRVDSLQPDRGQWLFGPFIHVYDSTGKRVAIGTGAVVAGAGWRIGDLHIHRISVVLPPDSVPPFTFQIGQYDGVHNANVLFTGPDGASAATIPVKP